MPRYLKVVAAQLGPNRDGTPREAIVDRMLTLHVYPEMALTTYFPKRIRTDFFLGRRQPQHYGEMLKPVTEKEPHR